MFYIQAGSNICAMVTVIIQKVKGKVGLGLDPPYLSYTILYLFN